jgi:hypothetical protein
MLRLWQVEHLAQVIELGGYFLLPMLASVFGETLFTDGARWLK